MTPQVKPIQRTVFDLDTFSDVTLTKPLVFTPVATVDEALTLMGNDEAKLLRAINKGLEQEARKEQGDNPEGFMVVEDGVSSPFAGTPADTDKVNALVLTLAKTVFGFHKDLDREEKAKRKEQAQEMIRSTPAIKEGLKKSAALGAVDGE